MQKRTSFYAMPQGDTQIWLDWVHSERAANSSWGSSTSTTLVDDYKHNPTESKTHDNPLSLCYSLTPPTPHSPDSDMSSSQLSIDSASVFDEMPEIPFVSSPVQYGNPWHHYRKGSAGHDAEHFWSSVIRPTASQSSDRSIAVLGHTNDRVMGPSRQRSGSLDSMASSRSKPAPAKSILSSSSSIRTRTGRSPSSVKFLDMPTIHYQEYEPESPLSPEAPLEIKKLGLLDRILRPMKKPQLAPARPMISGPIPLWEKPPRRVCSGAASLRSVKSSRSLRSVRSCSSRLQTYWGRITRRDN
ncbi:hypothetical protein BKA93DRAFT_536697 [Sparassis latifolia]